MARPKVERCHYCAFWKPEPQDEGARLVGETPSGQCRRYPPNSEVITYFDDWCGEFKALMLQEKARPKKANAPPSNG